MKINNKRKVYIKEAAVLENIARIEKYLEGLGCDLAISTKCLKLRKELLRVLDKKHRVYDVKQRNIKLLYKNHYHVISEFNLSHNASVIFDNKKAFSEMKNSDFNSIYLFFDFGDNREGLNITDIELIITYLHKTNFNEIVIMSNIGCLSEHSPDESFLDKFSAIKELFMREGFIVSRYSLGGSNCIPHLNKYKDNIKTEVRVGEAVFFGTYDGSPLDSLLLFNQIIHVETRLIKFINKGVGLYDFGYCDVESSDILEKNIIIIKQSANYSLVKTLSRQIDEKLLIPLSYRSLSKLSEQEKTHIYLV